MGRTGQLDPVYPVIFIDAIHVKIRDGKVANRPIYVALAVTAEGRRDILGLWAGEAPVGGGTTGEGGRHRTCRSCQAAILVEVGKALASS